MRLSSLILVTSSVLLLAATPLTWAQHPKKAPAAAPPVASTTTTATLKTGTLIVVETTNVLSSQSAQPGQSVPMRVKYDVKADGQTVIKAGSLATGQVTDAMHRKGMGKQGFVNIRATAAQAVDGQMVPLIGGNASTSGESTQGTSIALAAVVSPFFLLKKGKEAALPAGYEVQATVASEMTFKL